MADLTNLDLNEQERALYDRHLANLNGPGGVDNEDGSRSTLYAVTAEIDGKTYILPTVYDGKKLKPNDAIAKAEEIGLDKFPSYKTQKEASDRYDVLHAAMEQDTEEYMRAKATEKAFDPLSMYPNSGMNP